MAQGHAASLFIRAYMLTNEKSYLEKAKKSLDFMLVRVEKGGCLTKTPEGYYWIEEYPTDTPSLVLNGFIFALFGLKEYAIIVDNKKYLKLCAKFETSLKQTLSYYDTGEWLLYDRVQNKLVSKNYMGFQILQMYQMFQLTHDEWYLSIAEKWEGYFNWEDYFNYFNYEMPINLSHKISN